MKEGRVPLTGSDIDTLVRLAEKLRKEGKQETEQYQVLMRVLQYVIRIANERDKKNRNSVRSIREQHTSTGIFSATLYGKLESQIGELRSLLIREKGIRDQLSRSDPSIFRPPGDRDPCTAMSELMEVQIIPTEIDFSLIKEENEQLIKDRIAMLRRMLTKTEAHYAKKGKPLPTKYQILNARFSEEILAMQSSLRVEVQNALPPNKVLKGMYRPPSLVESQQKQREKAIRKARARETKRREKARREFLNAVCVQHRKTFVSFHREQKRQARNLGKAVLKELQSRMKKEEDKAKTAARNRLEALKANDEEKYMELLMEAKNERLMSLLKQTEDYMRKIGATIQAEQEKNRVLRNLSDDELDTDDNAAHNDSKVSSNKIDLAGTRKKYYNIAHKYKEVVKEQPKALIFGKLRHYQMAGLQWLVSLYNNNLNGILADEMGLGKTIQSISLLAYVMEKKKNKGPFLVIAPMATLHNNWAYEMNRWVPSMSMIVYDGSKDQRKKLREEDIAAENYNVLLTTFEFAMRDKRFLRKINWQYIIVDEAHRLKNPKCRLVSDLNEYSKSARRVALSGTPLQNDLPELWSLLNFLHPSIFNSCDNFQQWFAAPLERNLGESGDVDMNEEEKLLVIDRLHSILRPFVLRREKKEVESQLQDRVDVVLRCEMTPLQRTLYEALESGKISMHNRMVQLRKLCNHPYLFHPFCRGVASSYRYLLDQDLVNVCAKFRILDNLLPKLYAKKHRVLLFNQMTKSMDIIGHYLQYRKYRYLRLDGTTTQQTRVHNLNLFNAPDSPYFMFILSTKAGGLGLNLQTADTVILFDSDWNPQNDMQAQARAHRIGQLAKVISIRLITVGTVEEKVLETANNKRDMEAMVIQAGGFNKDYKAQEAKKLVKSVLRRGEDEKADRVSEANFINRSIARTDEEYEFYKKMDEDRNIPPAPKDKFPLWAWDFIFNGNRASETKQSLATREEADRLIVKVRTGFNFGDPSLLGKRRRRTKNSSRAEETVETVPVPRAVSHPAQVPLETPKEEEIDVLGLDDSRGSKKKKKKKKKRKRERERHSKERERAALERVRSDPGPTAILEESVVPKVQSEFPGSEVSVRKGVQPDAQGKSGRTRIMLRIKKRKPAVKSDDSSVRTKSESQSPAELPDMEKNRTKSEITKAEETRECKETEPISSENAMQIDRTGPVTGDT